MAGQQLLIGRIPYTNLFPIYHFFEKECDCSAYMFVRGFPSELNRLLREGRLDVSPSSSIEYLRNKELYSVLEGHSISSAGPVRSILLFSRKPIESLDGSTVFTTSQSETSVALLDIILKKFYRIDCVLRPTDGPLAKALASAPACLLIGDDALRESLTQRDLLRYDLGEIWFRQTGLPAVFALWITRKDRSVLKSSLFDQFRKDLDAAKKNSFRNIRETVKESPLHGTIPESEIISFWQGISFDFSEQHKKGLNLFSEYAGELKLL